MQYQYEYEYDRDRDRFALYVNDRIVYEMEYCDKMTDKEAEDLAEELYIDYMENK
jgi:hypothetical protein